MQSTFSVPVETLKLAMKKLEQEQASTKARQALPKKPNRSVLKQGIRTLPSNCLKWNAVEINRKSKQFDKAITKYSRLYNVDIVLIKSVITAESCFNTKAKSTAGAQGLMQLIPATAVRFGVSDSYDPTQNIRGGVKYLRFLLDRFKGDLTKVIAGYNAGEGAVDKHKGMPPYKETQGYVKNVLSVYSRLNPSSTHISLMYNMAKKNSKTGRISVVYNVK